MAHLHNIIDSDNRFRIDPVTRAIANTSGKVKLVQNDHNAERFTFEIPRLVDGHDMSLCDKVEIHYINVSGNKNEQSTDVYPVEDLTVDEWDEDKVVFSWLISANATKYEGTLNFLVRFVCLDGETIEYAWNTAIFDGITVDNGMDNGEAVIAEYSDVLEAWKREIFAEFKINFDAQTAAAMQAIQRKADETLATIPENYTAMDAAVKKNTANISRNSKRITNLEQGIPAELFETDDTVAYQKDVPSNARSYAMVSNIGGMTYKDGDTLKSAKVTAVKSVGANLFDVMNANVINGYIDTNSGVVSLTSTTKSVYIPCVPNTQYTVSKQLGARFAVGFCNVIPNSNVTVSNAVDKRGYESITVTSPSNAKYMIVWCYHSSYDTISFDEIISTVIINKGTTALPYTPYVEHTLPIPEAVQALDSFGDGISENVNNYIQNEVDGKWMWNKFVKKIVFDGVTKGAMMDSTDIQSNSTSYYAYMLETNLWVANNTKTIVNDLNVKVGTSMVLSLSLSNEILGLSEAPSKIEITAAINGYLNRKYLAGNPVMIVCQLADPIVTDISDLITSDNLIGVEGNGTITFENEYGYAVPSEVTYQMKGATA